MLRLGRDNLAEAEVALIVQAKTAHTNTKSPTSMIRAGLVVALAAFAAAIAPTQLRIEYSDSFTEESAPRVSWALSAPGERNIVQESYQIILARSDGTKVWDSSKVTSNRCVAVALWMHPCSTA